MQHLPIARRGEAGFGPVASSRPSYRPVRGIVAMAVVLGVLAAQAARTGEPSWIVPGLVGPVVLAVVALGHRWCRARRVDRVSPAEWPTT